MAIINIILRKMLNNRWLVGSLFLGLLITSSLVSSIPTYSSSILNKLLINELEEYQVKNDKFPGEFTFFVQIPENRDEKALDPKSYVNQLEKINSEVTKDTNLPIQSNVAIIRTAPLAVSYQDTSSHATSKDQSFGSLLSFSNIENHIELTDGKLPSHSKSGEIYEVIVPELALKKREMVLNTVFIASKGEEKILVKPVGTFKAKNENDPYWLTSPDSYSSDFILLEDQFEEAIFNLPTNLIENIKFYTALDYYAIKENQLDQLVGMERRTKEAVSKITTDKLFINFPANNIFKSYEEKSNQLKTMLWSLNVPLLIMLAIYLYMVTRLIIDRQKNEIAVLSSRGAKKSQILIIYLIEIGFLGVVAFLLGPFIGLLLCKALGATNGFLEFVQRSSLETVLMKEAFIYAFWAVALCVVMMMIPIYQASKQSIVNHKRNSVRLVGSIAWYTVIIEVFLLGISLYGWTVFKRRQEELLTIANEGMSFSVDPLLFFVPAAFIIGLGLLSLRIYPIVLKGLMKLGKKYFSLGIYSSLVQVSRASKQYVYLMLFLIMTIAVGVFSASAARTINNNLEEQIRYENGADVVLNVLWDSQRSGGNSILPTTPGVQTTGNNTEESQEASVNTNEVTYSEPPFEPFLQMSNTENVTKVFRKEGLNVVGKGEQISSVELMGIEPKEFGQTAWFKPSLMSHHWYEYLNLLAEEPSSVLISKTVASNLGVKEGDYVTLSWNQIEPVEFVVYGIIDYWPSFNPLQNSDTEEESNDPGLIVANLPYVQNMMGLEPYEVWLKTKPGAKREELYEEMKNLGAPLMNVTDSQPKIIELKNGAFLLGINGTLSLGFLISIVITFIGFLIYWILTMKSRHLQYGIYRAMGIPLRQLIGILLYEQLLTSGVACALGIGIGGLTSSLFVPLFQLSFNPKNIVPPFQVIFDSSDELTIYAFVFLTLLIGLTILAILLKNIRVHQAIKLGED